MHVLQARSTLRDLDRYAQLTNHLLQVEAGAAGLQASGNCWG